MDLHELISVTATAEPDVFVASVDLTDVNGERYIADYVSNSSDTFGLAPVVRAAVEQWIADGKPIIPYLETPAPIPGRVSRRQFGMQLIISGLKAAADGWVAQQDELTQWAYANSDTFMRADPMMQAGFVALGFSEQQVDEFFTAADAL